MNDKKIRLYLRAPGYNSSLYVNDLSVPFKKVSIIQELDGLPSFSAIIFNEKTMMDEEISGEVGSIEEMVPFDTILVGSGILK